MIYTLATAGHIDHGKSTLVKALTGINPDRLPEEQQREMTIDLGFAWFNLDDETEIGIVDGFAVLESDVVANLEAESVAVIVAGRYVFECPLVAMLNEDRAGEVAVDMFVLFPVAVEYDVFHNYAVNVFGREDRKNRCGCGAFLDPEILFG